MSPGRWRDLPSPSRGGGGRTRTQGRLWPEPVSCPSQTMHSSGWPCGRCCLGSHPLHPQDGQDRAFSQTHPWRRGGRSLAVGRHRTPTLRLGLCRSARPQWPTGFSENVTLGEGLEKIFVLETRGINLNILGNGGGGGCALCRVSAMRRP